MNREKKSKSRRKSSDAKTRRMRLQAFQLDLARKYTYDVKDPAVPPSNLTWEDHGISLTEILQRRTLPCLIALDAVAAGTPKNDVTFDVTQPLLLFSERATSSLVAVCLQEQCDQEPSPEVRETLIIPEAYPGFFQVVQDRDQKTFFFDSIVDVLRANCKRILVGGDKPIVCYRSCSDEVLPRRQLYPGSVVMIRDYLQEDFRKKSGFLVRRKKSKSGGDSFVQCFEVNGEEVLLPADARGIFFPVQAGDQSVPGGLMQMPDLVARCSFPCTVRLAWGSKPQSASAFTDTLRLQSLQHQRLATLHTVYGAEDTFLTLPVSTRLKVNVARDDGILRSDEAFRAAIRLCRQGAEEFEQSIKVFRSVVYKTEAVAAAAAVGTEEGRHSERRRDGCRRDASAGSRNVERVAETVETRCEGKFQGQGGFSPATLPKVSRRNFRQGDNGEMASLPDSLGSSHDADDFYMPMLPTMQPQPHSSPPRHTRRASPSMDGFKGNVTSQQAEDGHSASPVLLYALEKARREKDYYLLHDLTFEGHHARSQRQRCSSEGDLNAASRSPIPTAGKELTSATSTSADSCELQFDFDSSDSFIDDREPFSPGSGTTAGTDSIYELLFPMSPDVGKEEPGERTAGPAENVTHQCSPASSGEEQGRADASSIEPDELFYVNCSTSGSCLLPIEDVQDLSAGNDDVFSDISTLDNTQSLGCKESADVKRNGQCKTRKSHPDALAGRKQAVRCHGSSLGDVSEDFHLPYPPCAPPPPPCAHKANRGYVNDVITTETDVARENKLQSTNVTMETLVDADGTCSGKEIADLRSDPGRFDRCSRQPLREKPDESEEQLCLPPPPPCPGPRFHTYVNDDVSRDVDSDVNPYVNNDASRASLTWRSEQTAAGVGRRVGENESQTRSNRLLSLPPATEDDSSPYVIYDPFGLMSSGANFRLKPEVGCPASADTRSGCSTFYETSTYPPRNPPSAARLL